MDTPELQYSVVAPVEPTFEMIDAGRKPQGRRPFELAGWKVAAVWRAMIVRAPATPLSANVPAGPVSDSQLEEIAVWLDEAAVSIESWGACASEFFQRRGGLAEEAQKFRFRGHLLRSMKAVRP